jgi:hypothetical protein
MMMKSDSRKFVLTLHTTVTGVWLGSVVVYLTLVVVSLAGWADIGLAPTWATLALLGWYVVVPAALASFVSGVAMASSTTWGLFHHKWVVASLGLTTLGVVVLLSHMPGVTESATLANTASGAEADLHQALWSELLHSGLGLVVLLAIQAINVYKPAGLTIYGRRMREARPAASSAPVKRASPATAPQGSSRWAKIVWIHALILVGLFLIGHIALGGVPSR